LVLSCGIEPPCYTHGSGAALSFLSILGHDGVGYDPSSDDGVGVG
jgi:hypothetical protein